MKLTSPGDEGIVHPMVNQPDVQTTGAGLLVLVLTLGVTVASCTTVEAPSPPSLSRPPAASPPSLEPGPARVSEEPVVIAASIPPSLDHPPVSHLLEPPDVQLGDIFFEFDSARLTEEGQTLLRDYGEWLRVHDGVRATIEGHCDERGTEAYNLALGERRATTVKNYLTALGLPAARLSVVSYGKARPFCTDVDDTCYRLNRRAHLLVEREPVTARQH